MSGNKRNIPEIRERLLEIADEEDIPELYELVDEMYRNPPIRRASRRSHPLTPALAASIRSFARQNPNMHQQDIGARFNVNHGRVSEAMNNEM